MGYVLLLSGGKDSVYSGYVAMKRGIEIDLAITALPKRCDSYMFHYPNARVAKYVAEAMELDHEEIEVSGEKEREVEELYSFLKDLKPEGIVAGALASRYQRERVEKVAKRLGAKCYFPLWGVDQREYLYSLISQGFKVMIVGTYVEGLEECLGKVIDSYVLQRLERAYEVYKINFAGEGGEYETLVLEGPSFKKKLIIREYLIRRGRIWRELEILSVELI